MHQAQWSPERPLPPPVSLASQSHHEKPPEVTCTSRGNPWSPASTRERPREITEACVPWSPCSTKIEATAREARALQPEKSPCSNKVPAQPKIILKTKLFLKKKNGDQANISQATSSCGKHVPCLSTMNPHNDRGREYDYSPLTTETNSERLSYLPVVRAAVRSSKLLSFSSGPGR